MAKKTRAGLLRDACELQTQTNTEDVNGGFSVTYTTFATVPCSIDNISQYSKIENRGSDDVLSHLIEIRWRPDVDISTRILFRDVRYGVGNLQDVNMKRERLKLYCYMIAGEDEFNNPSPASDLPWELYNG